MNKTSQCRINKNRILKTLSISSSIGATKNGGLNRLALTESDQIMRNQLIEWFENENLHVNIDDFGNIYGEREGRIKDGPAIAVGSHLDSQPYGGRFDGVLGVIAALEVVRVINENNIETDYPIKVINFTNEEGARFEPPMLGSGGISGVFTKDFIYNITDKNKVTFKEALTKIGFAGEQKNRLKNVKNFVELHIEQGPVLEENDVSIGIVEGVQGMSWLDIICIGETNHAGPTPMNNRKDALIPASKMIAQVNELTKNIDGLKITVGKLNVTPNIPNVIPGGVQFSIDIRHQDDNIRLYAIDRIKETINELAVKHNIEVNISNKWDSPAVYFSNEVKTAIDSAAKMLNYSTLHLYSGPGHDAKYMTRLANTGMIFVKSINGISHNENELTLDEDIVKGANVLLHTVLNLAYQ